jgi:cytochrome c oxidase subunit 1
MTAVATTYRTCPRSGLQFERQAEMLIKAHAFVGVVWLLIGGLLAIGVVLTRWPAVRWLEADTFYMVLTAHGLDMLIFWIIFFEIAILHFCSSTLLRCRIATPKIAWLGFALMVIGSVLNNVAVFRGGSSVMMTSYVPMMAEPSFYLGIILFAVGALIGCFVFFGTLVVARREKTYEGSIPLVTFGALTAAIIAVFTLLSGAMIIIPAWLMSLGLMTVDPLIYRTVWWALGHSSQQINVAAHVSVWYLVAAIALGAKPMSERVSRTAFLLYILFLQLASAHHLLADPGVGTAWKVVNTSYFMYLAVLASMLHGLTVPGAMEVAQRQKGYTKGLFEWLRKAPWGNPTFAGVFISIIGFGFLGGITGVMMGTEQLNLIIHNTIYVPGHFHATVVVGTTLTFMALTYYLIPVLFKREMIAPKLAQWQPYLFGFSMYFLLLGDDGRGNAGCVAPPLGHGFPGRRAGLRMAGCCLPDDGAGGHRWHGGDCRWRHLHLRHRRFLAVGSQARRRCQQPEVHAAGACHAHGGGPDRRRGWLHRARHLRAGAGVPGRLRALLLHQLEVPLDPVGPELMVARDPRPA